MRCYYYTSRGLNHLSRKEMFLVVGDTLFPSQALYQCFRSSPLKRFQCLARSTAGLPNLQPLIQDLSRILNYMMRVSTLHLHLYQSRTFNQLIAASPLLPSSQQTVQLTLRQILSNPSLRGPSLLCAAIMALQQLSGVNAVMFYSTPVLRPLLPTSVGIVGIGITIVNAIMTLPAMLLMDVSAIDNDRKETMN